MTTNTNDMAPIRVRPFSNGSQFSDWEDRNCWRCKKSYHNNPPGKREDGYDMPYNCELDEAITVAYLGDGTLSEEQGKRIGYTESDPPHYTWKCAEFEKNT